MAEPRTLEEYEIRIQDYKEFNEILEKIYLGNVKIIADLEIKQAQLLNDMQNSQSTDKED